MFKQITILFCLVLTLVFADEVLIYEPVRGAIYQPNDVMDIRYAGKKKKNNNKEKN